MSRHTLIKTLNSKVLLTLKVKCFLNYKSVSVGCDYASVLSLHIPRLKGVPTALGPKQAGLFYYNSVPDTSREESGPKATCAVYAVCKNGCEFR